MNPVGHMTWRRVDLHHERPERSLVRAEGCTLHYDDGTTALDASGGPVCVGVGHGRREVAEAVAAQMACVSYGFDAPVQREFRERLARHTPGDLNRVYPCSGGSEAVEAAIRFARHHHYETGRRSKYKVIARWASYHGNTLGAASLSGGVPRRAKWDPLLVPFPHVEPCYCYRCPFRSTYPDCGLLCAEKLETAILREGPDSVAAFIAEPIVGATAGVVIPPDGYFRRIREICDKYDVLFIADEVMTGFGRTGRWFAMEHWGVLPDMMTLGKGITSGYVPMGALVVRESLMAPAEPRVSDFGNIHTFSYHPVAAAASCAVMEILERESLVERSRTMGERLLAELRARLGEHPLVGDIRGLGMFAGVEIVRDRATRDPFPREADVAARVVDRCARRGVRPYSGGGMSEAVTGDHVMIAPPFVATEDEIRAIVSALAASIEELRPRGEKS